jgi:DNA-binding CsgD family transcriptional regulator
MTGSNDDPLIPLSVLGKAMACWISLTLPAREVFNLRMQNRSLARIANILGCTKQSVAGVLERAIKENPVMASLACGSQDHRKGRKRRKSE